MPDRVTEADLARIEHSVQEWYKRHGYLDQVCIDQKSLVDEVRQLRSVLKRIAEGVGWGSAPECWCAEIAENALGKEETDG